jgi:hypothetical protein
MRERSSVLASREEELLSQRQQIANQQKQLQSQAADVEKLIQDRLGSERAEIATAEAKRIKAEFQGRLDAARRDQETQTAKIAELENSELDFRKKSAALEDQKRQLELNVARQIDAERNQIRSQVVLEEQTRSQSALASKDKSLAELKGKLAESQRVELEVRKQRESLEDEKKSLDLEVSRRVDAERQRIREAAQKEEDDRSRLKLAEKDKVIDDMRKQVDELRRKSEQGSQQLQGEVQEMELEAVLRSQFPQDEFEPFAVGRPGGDLIQKVIGPGGMVSGTILWESKRTKSWTNDWLAKVRENQRNVRASLGVIVSTALPKGLVNFDRIEDVWVSGLDCLIPLAKALRFTLLQTAVLQLAGQDRSGKTERMYSYVTAQDFKHMVSSIMEGYVSLRTDLEREKRSVTAAWAKREKFHDLVMMGTAGLYGDLHGILGKSMPEIEGLEAPQLPSTIGNLLPDDTPLLQLELSHLQSMVRKAPAGYGMSLHKMHESLRKEVEDLLLY